MRLDGIWVEKYRPSKLDDLIASDEIKKKVKGFGKSKQIPNILLTSQPGTGKSSLAKIIVKDILDCDYLYINASDENGIDTIRDKVTHFAQTKSFDGNVKVIILEEADLLSFQAQGALRNTMETFAEFTRFILTANYKHKIIPALQSRCQQFNVDPDISNTVKRVIEILKAENIVVDTTQREPLKKLVTDCFPDIRKTINEIQKNCIDGRLCISHTSSNSELHQLIVKYIFDKKTIQLRKYLIENEDLFNGDYDSLMTHLLDYIYSAHDIDEINKKVAIVTLADHIYKSVFVIDKEINAFACFLQIERDLS